MIRSKIWSIFILLFFPLVVIAGTIDPSIPDSKYLDYAKDFHCVVSICGVDKDNNLFCASAVAIDDHHILTAAHVVDKCKICFIYLQDKKYIISKVTVHKDFDETFGIGDIALGYSEDSFDLNFYPSLYTESDEVGKTCSLSGYGLTGTFHTGAVVSDGKRRAGSNKIINIDRDMLICDPSPRTSQDYTGLEFLIASGDSGGGLFIGNKLAGIHSCVITIGKKSPKSKYGEESGHTRVSKFVEWINNNKVSVNEQLP